MDDRKTVLFVVCSYYSIHELKGNTHKAPYPDARKMAIKLLTRNVAITHTEIAKLLGVTRSSISWSWKRAKLRFQSDLKFMAQYEVLKNRVDHAIKT